GAGRRTGEIGGKPRPMGGEPPGAGEREARCVGGRNQSHAEGPLNVVPLKSGTEQAGFYCSRFRTENRFPLFLEALLMVAFPYYDSAELKTLETQADAILGAFRARGYVREEPSVLQPADIFLDRSGEEIRRRTFTLTDPSGRDLCLRPDLT